MRKAAIALVCGALLMLAGIQPAAAQMFHSWDQAYYAEHPQTIQQLAAKIGSPDKVVKLDNGQECWIYRNYISAPACFDLVVTVDEGQVVNRKLK